MKILGISAFYHDSACALIDNGILVGAVQEEVYTRRKHDPSFPINSIKFCLSKIHPNMEVALEQVDYIVFYDKPFLKFERIMETYLDYAPWRGITSFICAMKQWAKGKFNTAGLIRREIKKSLAISGKKIPTILFDYHHASHAASAFYPSPYKQAAILCLDGVGEWATTSAWQGDNATMTPLWQIDFPHSLGLFYSAISEYCGFKVNSGEYKLMGLSSYGESKFANYLKECVIEIKKDGSFHLNMEYFDYPHGQKMGSKKLHSQLNRYQKSTENILEHRMNVASSTQQIVEEVVIKLSKTLHKDTGLKNLTMAGGVALNCVANSKIIPKTPFDSLWIQPAAGDAGGAVGAAYHVWYQFLGKTRTISSTDSMNHALLGPKYSNREAQEILNAANVNYTFLQDEQLIEAMVEALLKGLIIGHFDGCLEFGPRALGNRSILADPRCKDMQNKINQKIKMRESFRPFAMSILEEHCGEIFESVADPYMLLVSYILPKWRKNNDLLNKSIGIDKLNVIKSPYPSCTHVDYSCRLQTVSSSSPLRLRRILQLFYSKTKCPGLINTSFNVRGEPIVASPYHAYRCFMNTDMDICVINNFWLEKSQQKNEFSDKYINQLELD